MVENGYPTDFFHVNKIIQRVIGLWLPGREVSLILRLLYHSAVILAYTMTAFFLICEFIILHKNLNDINKFVSQFGMLLTHTVGVMKFFIMIFYRKKIENMMDALQDKKYMYQALDNFQPGQMMRESKIASSFVSVMVAFLYLFVGISAHITSVITINKTIKSNYFHGSFTCYDFLPYYFYVPFSVKTKNRCHMAFLFMNLSLDGFALFIACFDGIFITLLNCLKTQMEIVQAAIRNIRGRSLKILNLPEDYEIFLDKDNQTLEKTLYEELTHCIKHLNLLLRIRDDIESLYSYVTLAQTLASLIIFASCLYVASSVSMTSPEFFAQVEYFLCVLTQLSVICYFGNEITVASEQTGNSLYECDWLSSSTRFKRSMILTMCRMQRPVYLSIGKFTPITLATLVAVGRGSFSYFALFKSIQ